jgi:hypothetical protein
LVGFLAPFVGAFGRFERGRRASRQRAKETNRSFLRAPAGVILLVAGLAGLAQFGFSQTFGPEVALLGSSVTHCLCLAAGYRLLSPAKSKERS